MNTEAASKRNSSSSDLTIFWEGFELDRCVDESNSEPNEIADTKFWSSPPPPQKFSRANKAQNEASKCTSRKLTSKYRAQSCRAVGIMLSRDEAAHWTCSEAEVQNSACAVADLLIMQHTS